MTERETALAEATRLRNQIHHLLLQLDPEYESQMPSLTSAAGLRAVETYPTPMSSALQQHRAAAIRRLAQRMRLATEQAAALEREICTLAEARYAPLTRLKGMRQISVPKGR